MRSNARNTPDRDIPTRAPIRANDQPFARRPAISLSRSAADKLYNRSAIAPSWLMSMNDPLEKRPHDARHATTATPCTCHLETGGHELCCGHEQGRNPDCPIHGDGYTILAW